jgi:hypothetical protein
MRLLADEANRIAGIPARTAVWKMGLLVGVG